MSSAEYQQAVNVLNMIFGAVLGFVLAGTEQFSASQFVMILIGVTLMVFLIQSIHSDTYRIWFAVLAVLADIVFPNIMKVCLGDDATLPDKIMPTLYVWTAFVILIEFSPRHGSRPQQP